jgi:hypothetical protein
MMSAKGLNSPEWSPNSEFYTKEESKCVDEEGYVRRFKGTRATSSVVHDDGEFIRSINELTISHDSIRETVSGINSEKFKLDADVLCTNWGISKSIAENTIKATTHLRVKTVNHPNVERRWPTGDQPLRYCRLDHAVYLDTMYSQVKSSRGNKCCKIYVTDFGWSRSFPMTKESEVHEPLDLFLGRFGIPEALISDGAKSYTGGEYRKKAKQAGIFCKLTDPYIPWQNQAESEIKEVKRLASKWTVKSQSPCKLWDHAIELASIVRPHLALDMYKLNGQIPETIMLGQTADISFICSFAWYNWVYYNKQNAAFPALK